MSCDHSRHGQIAVNTKFIFLSPCQTAVDLLEHGGIRFQKQLVLVYSKSQPAQTHGVSRKTSGECLLTTLRLRKPRMNTRAGSCILNVKICFKSFMSATLFQARKMPTASRIKQCKKKLNYLSLFFLPFIYKTLRKSSTNILKCFSSVAFRTSGRAHNFILNWHLHIQLVKSISSHD